MDGALETLLQAANKVYLPKGDYDADETALRRTIAGWAWRVMGEVSLLGEAFFILLFFIDKHSNPCSPNATRTRTNRVRYQGGRLASPPSPSDPSPPPTLILPCLFPPRRHPDPDHFCPNHRSQHSRLRAVASSAIRSNGFSVSPGSMATSEGSDWGEGCVGSPVGFRGGR